MVDALRLRSVMSVVSDVRFKFKIDEVTFCVQKFKFVYECSEENCCLPAAARSACLQYYLLTKS